MYQNNQEQSRNKKSKYNKPRQNNLNYGYRKLSSGYLHVNIVLATLLKKKRMQIITVHCKANHYNSENRLAVDTQ